MHRRPAIVAVFLLVFAAVGEVHARTVYRCMRDGTVSLSTAPESGSKCTAKTIDDNAAMLPNLWGDLGVFSGTLYEWHAPDGRVIYTTRRMPGAAQYLASSLDHTPGLDIVGTIAGDDTVLLIMPGEREAAACVDRLLSLGSGA